MTGVDLDTDDVEIAYDGTVVARGGVGVGVDEDQLSARLGGDFTLAIRIGAGPGQAKVVTTDILDRDGILPSIKAFLGKGR